MRKEDHECIKKPSGNLHRGRKAEKKTGKLEHAIESKQLFKLSFFLTVCDSTSHLNPDFGLKKQLYMYVIHVD